MGGKTGNKAGYFDKLKGLLEDYKSLFVVSVDNVSSQQMHEIRQSLRADGVVLMGKNTMVSSVIENVAVDEQLLIYLRLHRCAALSRPSCRMRLSTSVFSLSSRAMSDSSSPIQISRLSETRSWRTRSLRLPVLVPSPQSTYGFPRATLAWSQARRPSSRALQVPTKIARGTIEITQDLKLIESGNKVGASEATLLNILNISPFTYGMQIAQVYDQGNAFPPEVLDIGEDQLLKAFASAVTTIASLSLALNYPTLPSVFHSLVNSYKNVLAIAVETDISWPEIESLKDRIANPDAYAAAAPAATETATEEKKEAEEEKKEDEEDGSDSEGGFGGLLSVDPLLASYRLSVCTANTVTATKCATRRVVYVLGALQGLRSL